MVHHPIRQAVHISPPVLIRTKRLFRERQLFVDRSPSFALLGPFSSMGTVGALKDHGCQKSEKMLRGT